MQNNRFSLIRNIVLYSSILLFTASTAVCQETEKKEGRPDIPGTFVLEIGINSPRGASSEFSTGFWGSRTANVYYQYDVGMSIFTEKLTFVPGIGLGLERFKFRNNYVMEYDGTGDLTLTESEQEIRKSQLITNYLDIPLGLRYTSKPHDPTRSFRLEGGIRGGLLISSFTKVIHDDDGELVKTKTRRNWELNKYRYGLYFKTGFGNFSLVSYYNMSTLFKKGKAPGGDDINNLTVGISLGGF